jgi:hypothetical protein
VSFAHCAAYIVRRGRFGALSRVMAGSFSFAFGWLDTPRHGRFPGAVDTRSRSLGSIVKPGSRE